MSADPAASDYGISASAKQVAAAPSAAVSQRELNSRVDSRIRKFMKEGGTLGAGLDEERDPRERVRALRRDIEMSRSYQADRSGRETLDCEDFDVTDRLHDLHQQIRRLENDRDKFSARRSSDSRSMDSWSTEPRSTEPRSTEPRSMEPRSMEPRSRRGMSPDYSDLEERGMRAEARLASLKAQMSAAASASAKKDTGTSGADRLRALRRECEEAAAVAKERLAQSAEPARATKGRTGKKPDFDY
jgi:hypothetical protein